MSPRISVISTTYNQSRELALSLESLSLQTHHDFELVIADDGSREDTRAVVDEYRRRHFGERLLHVWHEDQGYRKSKIVNEAIRRSKGEWLIFIDSDVIVHPKFVEDHVSCAGKNTLIMGRRVDLGERVSQWVRCHPELLFSFAFYFRVFRSSLGSIAPTRGVKRSIRLESRVLRSLLRTDLVPDLLGSNFSVDRELLFRVNGFDEALEHYWGEDGDLFIRLRNSGVRICGRKNFAVQWHLWHRQRQPQAGAEERYHQRVIEDHTSIRCQSGLLAVRGKK